MTRMGRLPDGVKPQRSGRDRQGVAGQPGTSLAMTVSLPCKLPTWQYSTGLGMSNAGRDFLTEWNGEDGFLPFPVTAAAAPALWRDFRQWPREFYGGGCAIEKLFINQAGYVR